MNVDRMGKLLDLGEQFDISVLAYIKRKDFIHCFQKNKRL